MKPTTALATVLLASAAALAHANSAASVAPEGGFAPLLFSGAANSARSAAGYLGISIRDVAPEQVAALKLKDAHGAEIILVDHDAPAGKAGLREHDVVLMMNGQVIDGQDQLRRMLHESPPGRSIVLVISRDGQIRTITTQMATQEEVEREATEQRLTVPEPQDPPADSLTNTELQPATAPAPARMSTFVGAIVIDPNYTGVMLETMSTQLADFFGATDGPGLLVRSVQDNSPGAAAGIRAGDVVIRANQRPMTSAAEWEKAVKNSHGQPLAITILRDRKEQTLTLTPDGRKRSSLEPEAFPEQSPTDGDGASSTVLARAGMSLLPRS